MKTLRSLMEASNFNIQQMLKKHQINLSQYVEIENGWLVVELDREADWGSLQDIDEHLSEADPNQKMYRDMTARGDDVPWVFYFNIQFLDQIDQLLRQIDTTLKQVVGELPGPGVYNDQWSDEEDDDEDDY